MPGTRFAILTATHEGTFDYLPFCVDSVRGQAMESPGDFTYTHVVVNDGSVRTKEYLDEEAKRDPRILPVHLEHNSGYVAALRAGELAVLKMAKEAHETSRVSYSAIYPHYYLVVDSDDGLTPTALLDYVRAELRQWNETQTLPGVMFGKVDIIDEYGQPLGDVPHIRGYNDVPDPGDYNSFMHAMLRANQLPSKPAIRWEYFDIGRIPNVVDGERVTCPDWLLALSALSQCAQSKSQVRDYVFIPKAMSYYRVRPGQMSVDDSVDGTWERERVKLVEGKFNPFKPTGLTLEHCGALYEALCRILPEESFPTFR